MRFDELTIPEGEVDSISVGGVVIWRRGGKVRYVSLGDSIAAGHTITEDWEQDYGTGSQYGENGNTSTTIVPDCYTDLTRRHLISTYGEDKVRAVSFAHSGDTVADLMEKLTHDRVRSAVATADYVTICIGANDILGSVSGDRIKDYVLTGSLAEIEAEVEANLNKLDDDSNAASYRGLLDRLYELNPSAQIVFTTVYNPYKYLWAQEGKDGFFAPLLATIPELTVLGVDLSGLLKDAMFSVPIVQQFFTRANALGSWVETRVTRLDSILMGKIDAHPSGNFKLADTKAVFDGVPDRPVTAPYHYNDLVSVEYTRGYDTWQMDWGRLYENNVIKDQNGNQISATVCNDASTFWWTLVDGYRDGITIDYAGLFTTLIAEMVEHVLMPDMDPHPETYGQYALSRSFGDAFGWWSLPRYTVSYAANGGSGSTPSQQVVGIDAGVAAYTTLKSSAFSAADAGHYFTGWNSAAGGGGTAYTEGQLVGLTSSLALYAQWGVRYFTLTYKHSQGDVIQLDSGQTGPMDYYTLYIDGTAQSKLGAFSNGARSLSLPYGTSVKVVAAVSDGDGRSYVSWNGTTVAGKSSSASYPFSLTSNVTVNFEWNQWYSTDNWIPRLQSYWNCYITTS